MSMTDPIADMLTRIRNGCLAKHERIEMPSSKLKVNIAKILKDEGFILNHKVSKDGKQGILKIFLRYADGEPVIMGLKRISKPGRRIYCRHDNIPRIMGGLGVAIISTSKGMLTDQQAREAGVGGEVICAVW